MVKVFSVNCIFGNQRQPFNIYIGSPEKSHHPVHWQNNWLSTSKGGMIPEDFLNSLQKLFDSSIKNNANFEELCEYALISASKNVNGQNNDGIAKITSTVKSTDIEKYANEFNSKKTLNNAEQQAKNSQNTPPSKPLESEIISEEKREIKTEQTKEVQTEAASFSSQPQAKNEEKIDNKTEEISSPKSNETPSFEKIPLEERTEVEKAEEIIKNISENKETQQFKADSILSEERKIEEKTTNKSENSIYGEDEDIL